MSINVLQNLVQCIAHVIRYTKAFESRLIRISLLSNAFVYRITCTIHWTKFYSTLIDIKYFKVDKYLEITYLEIYVFTDKLIIQIYRKIMKIMSKFFYTFIKI